MVLLVFFVMSLKINNEVGFSSSFFLEAVRQCLENKFLCCLLQSAIMKGSWLELGSNENLVLGMEGFLVTVVRMKLFIAWS